MYKKGTNKAIPPPSVNPIDRPNCGIFSTFTLGKIVIPPSNAYNTIAEAILYVTTRTPVITTAVSLPVKEAIIKANAAIGCITTRNTLTNALRNLFIIFNLG